MLPSKAFLAMGIATGGWAAGLAACSSSSSPAGGTSVVTPMKDASSAFPAATPLCTDGGLNVAFHPMYSACDGKHTFQIPAVVLGSNKNVTWSADETVVGMQADNERPNEVLITALKPGSVAINVQSEDGKCGSSILTIDSATEADWEIGNARYNNGQSLHLTGGASATGSPLEQGGGGPACTSCHGQTATTGPYTNVSHTPEQTGGFSDDELINIILNGTFPDGGYFDTNIVPYPIWQNFHRWADITPDQEKGIIVYLRSLTPSAQTGQVNFGAFLPEGGSDDASDASSEPLESGVVDGSSPALDGGVDGG